MDAEAAEWGADIERAVAAERTRITNLDTLGSAWSDVYQALPVGWMFRGIWCRQYRRVLKWTAVAEPSPRGLAVVGIADSPIDALVALTMKLRDMRK